MLYTIYRLKYVVVDSVCRSVLRVLRHIYEPREGLIEATATGVLRFTDALYANRSRKFSYSIFLGGVNPSGVLLGSCSSVEF